MFLCFALHAYLFAIVQLSLLPRPIPQPEWPAPYVTTSTITEFTMDNAHALFATDAFYLAFAGKDIDAMDALWARETGVLCVHPGWPRLTEREAIMESWRNILSNPTQSGPKAYAKEAHSWGNVVGVTCYEQLEGGVILATKAFVLEDGECRLVMHQGSPCNNPPDLERLADASEQLQ